MYEIQHEGETFRFQSSMMTDLMSQLLKWHRAKDVAWPGESEMRARVEDYICQFTPKSFCKGGDGPKYSFLSVRSIREATRLLTSKLAQGENFLVSPEEAERRAKVCLNCPLNLKNICTSCAGSEFASVLKKFIVKGAETRYDQQLDTCRECGCLLQAKVHVSIEALAKQEKHTYPSNCWLYGTAAHKEEEPSAS